MDDTDSSLRVDDQPIATKDKENNAKKGEESPWTPLEETSTQAHELRKLSVDSEPWTPTQEAPRKLGQEAWSSLDDIRRKKTDDAWSPRQTSVDLPLWGSEDGKRRGTFTPASDNLSPLPLSQIRLDKGSSIITNLFAFLINICSYCYLKASSV